MNANISLFQNGKTMKKEIKRRWIEALRSGEYTQWKNALRSENEFCCLGVLCDLYSKEKGVKWDAVSIKYFTFAIHNEVSILPNEVVKWAGLPDNNPEIGRLRATLINDSSGASFEEIARMIDVYL